MKCGLHEKWAWKCEAFYIYTPNELLYYTSIFEQIFPNGVVLSLSIFNELTWNAFRMQKKTFLILSH